MFCSNCGASCPSRARFCPECGSSLEEGVSSGAMGEELLLARPDAGPEARFGNSSPQGQPQVLSQPAPYAPAQAEPQAGPQAHDRSQAYAQPSFEQAAYAASPQQQAPAGPGAPAASGGPVRSDRSLLAYILLSWITCGIYAFYFVYKLIQDLDVICANDGDEMPGFLTYLLLCIVTCGLYAYWWQYKVGNRLSNNAPRYGLSFQENGTTVLVWDIAGLLLCGLGPFVAMHIIIKNTNALASAYNAVVAC